MEPSTPLTDMSRTRSWTSKQPTACPRARWLDPVLLGRAAHDGVQADVGDLVAVVHPDVGAVVPADELGRRILVLGRQEPVDIPGAQ